MALMCIVAINGANVFVRYVFGSPFSWAEELMLFLMILGVFSGAIAITWRNIHIRIDTVVDGWRRRPDAWCRCWRFAYLHRRPQRRDGRELSAGVAVATMDQRSDALNAPSWIPQSFVTVGLGLMAVMMAVKLVISFRR